jgi:hypothetical protein
MRALQLLALAPVVLAGCRGPSEPNPTPAFRPTAAIRLPGNGPGKDEDPSVLRARDGRMILAWFSDRTGNAEIHVTATSDGEEWTSPVRVTNHQDGDFYPNLIQDEAGAYHLTWFRWQAPLLGSIWYATSADGRSWPASAQTQVTTTSLVDDWVPTIVQAVDGTLLIYFVSDKRDAANPTNQIYVTRKGPAETGWSPPAPAAGINSATEHDHLPFAARTGSQITLVWVRNDTRAADPWLHSKSDLHYASSPDGLAWSVPVKITTEAAEVVHVFPQLYPGQTGAWAITWLSTRGGPPAVLEMPLAQATSYPEAASENRELGAGYSHRIAATPASGVYLGVWTQGPDGAQDIFYRFFRR